jgi:gliding motility-associated-like protein
VKRITKILFLFCFCFHANQLHATHIVGGDVSVRWVSGNDFEVTLTFFRDCSPGSFNFDDTIACGIYDKVNNSRQQVFSMPLATRFTLDLGDTCFTPPGLCVEKGVYKTNVTIPDNSNGYYIAWQRCCRNDLIVNIQNPLTAGMVFYAEIPDPAFHDNSPVFGSYPNVYMCASQVNIRDSDFVCSDADGDSLVYTLITPMNGYATQINTGTYPLDTVLTEGPYPDISWQSPYGPADMMGGIPPMSIDFHTGILTSQPTNQGIYVFAVRVEEYRNGVKIGEVRRDIQYVVLPCPTHTPPVFTSPVTTTISDPSADTTYTIVAGDALSFDLTLTSSNPNDSVFLYGTSELFSSQAHGMTYSFHNDSALGTVQQNFFLQTTCDAIRDLPYHLEFDGIKYTCYGLLKTTVGIDIYVTPPQDGFLDSLVPNVFTPNGDGKNDFFHIKANANDCFDRFKLKIYNRWGTLMYETSDFLFQWDGTNKSGVKLSEGVYYYILDASFIEHSFTKRGFIHLLK